MPEDTPPGAPEDDANAAALDDANLVLRINQDIKDCRDLTETWRKDAEEDFNFVAGHQWDEDDILKLEAEKRPVITFNRVNVIIAAILGIEENQRTEPTFLPHGTEDNGLSEATGDFHRWVRDYGELEVENAASFEDMITCGMGWSESSMDYETDLNGKYIEESVYPLEMYWDPTAKKRNLKDRQWQARAKKYSVRQIKERWPDAEVMESTTAGVFDDVSGSVTNTDPQDAYDGTNDAPNKKKTRPTVVQYQWYELESVYRAQDLDGDLREFSEEEFDQVKEKLAESGIDVIKQKKRKYHQAFITGSELLEKG